MLFVRVLNDTFTFFFINLNDTFTAYYSKNNVRYMECDPEIMAW